MSVPVISVIVPVYNKAPVLKRCLDSLVAQTYKNLDIVAYDDASTDGSAEMLDRYEDSRLRVLHGKKNHGASYARNRAMEAATGEWLVLQDADDFSNHFRIELQYHAQNILNRPIIRAGIVRFKRGLGLNPDEKPVPACSCGGGGTFMSTMLPASPIVPFEEDMRFYHEHLWAADTRHVFGRMGVVYTRLYYHDSGKQPERGLHKWQSPEWAEVRILCRALLLERKARRRERLSIYVDKARGLVESICGPANSKHPRSRCAGHVHCDICAEALLKAIGKDDE